LKSQNFILDTAQSQINKSIKSQNFVKYYSILRIGSAYPGPGLLPLPKTTDVTLLQWRPPPNQGRALEKRLRLFLVPVMKNGIWKLSLLVVAGGRQLA